MSCYHLSHNLLLTRVGLCSFTNRVLSVAGFSSRITRVTTISVQVGYVVERVTLGHPPYPLHCRACNSVLTTQYYSITDVNLCLSTYHKNYTILCLRNGFPFPRLSLFVSVWDVTEHLSNVEGNSVA